jgi:hypothetical protein
MPQARGYGENEGHDALDGDNRGAQIGGYSLL